MNTQPVFFSRIQSAGLLAALRTKLDELSLQWQQAALQRQEIARIEHELSICSDRQLADLGFRRSDIPDVARGLFSQA